MSITADLEWLLPEMKTTVQCPGTYKDPFARCPGRSSISGTIMHLNDHHQWSRLQIADWLDTLDADLTFPTEPPPRPSRHSYYLYNPGDIAIDTATTKAYIAIYSVDPTTTNSTSLKELSTKFLKLKDATGKTWHALDTFTTAYANISSNGWTLLTGASWIDEATPEPALTDEDEKIRHRIEKRLKCLKQYVTPTIWVKPVTPAEKVQLPEVIAPVNEPRNVIPPHKPYVRTTKFVPPKSTQVTAYIENDKTRQRRKK